MDVLHPQRATGYQLGIHFVTGAQSLAPPPATQIDGIIFVSIPPSYSGRMTVEDSN